jgi:hypothetical protein
MATKKKFDCVEMKNAAQQQLRQEYETRKSEFSSFVDFINAKSQNSPEIRRFRERVAKSKSSCA